MKKAAALLLVCILSVGFAACRRRDTTAAQPPAQSVAEPQEQPEGSAEADQPSSRPEGQTEPADTPGAEKAAEELLAALQSGDRQRIREHVDYENFLMLEGEGQSDADALAVLARLQYEIVQAEAQGETATVTASLINVDMTSVLPDYVRRAMELEYNNAVSQSPLTQEELASRYQGLLQEALNSAPDNATHTVQIKLNQRDGKWHVLVDDALREAATGNYFAAKRQMGNNAGGGQS